MQLPNSAQELQLIACFTITLRPSYLHVAAFLERRVATTVAFAQGALEVAAEAARTCTDCSPSQLPVAMQL